MAPEQDQIPDVQPSQIIRSSGLNSHWWQTVFSLEAGKFPEPLASRREATPIAPKAYRDTLSGWVSPRTE